MAVLWVRSQVEVTFPSAGLSAVEDVESRPGLTLFDWDSPDGATWYLPDPTRALIVALGNNICPARPIHQPILHLSQLAKQKATMTS